MLALTGGTGFVGSHVIDRALAAGHAIRALARKPQLPRDGVEWIAGALDDTASLEALVDDADAVVHIAGIVNAPDRAGFAAGNVHGTVAIVDVSERARVQRFIHVSSLAAREPGLSNYGWSKAQAETIVTSSALDWTIVRPPALFGPRDADMLEIFRLAKFGVVPLPAGGRGAMLFAPDLAQLLLSLATGDAATGTILEPDDGTPGGWDHRDMARAIGVAVGRRIWPLSLPGALLALIARTDRLVRGAGAKLTPDRVGYLRHPDWTAHLRPPASLWSANTPTPDALAQTARWYRANGLL